jgi:hypothetical protein
VTAGASDSQLAPRPELCLTLYLHLILEPAPTPWPPLPAGGVAFLPVPTDSLEFQMGVAWQFPSFAVALGRSYFQRLLRALPNLGRAAARCPALADLSGDGAGGGGPGDSGSQEQGLWGAAWSEVRACMHAVVEGTRCMPLRPYLACRSFGVLPL